MTLRLHDSRTQSLRDFVPLVDGRVGIYVCGPTVQSAPHIGHLRSALAYDQLRRWLTHRGLDVTLVRNVTDIDDKVIDNARRGQEAGGTEEWWALAYRVELEFSRAYSALGILPPSYEPRATASIGEMQEIIRRLVERGHAYAADDRSGDVYFDTASWPEYGELTRQRAADMEAAADADPRAKRDVRDFALWKGAKPGEPASASWPSPWGSGRPGWHIECSAMSTRYLGAEFDIHGGGLDLRFPHHENELAQSRAAGDPFARYWLHNGLVAVAGQKMSKSLGNSLFAADLLASARPVVVRYFLGSAHYRSTLEFHDGALAEAEAALDRIETFLDRSARRLAGTRFQAAPAAPDGSPAAVPAEFAEAMDDDLSVPQALAVLHDAVRAGNAALDAGDLQEAASLRADVSAMVAVLGIDPLADEWRTASDQPARRALQALVEHRIAERQTAREARDFALADRIRQELAEAGITIEDSPGGSHWSIDGE
ncbi:cysteine--tRNA ligase [Clavibacter michiganensis]|uniref:cysteine--tRNA ligase n=1 Tax=Clavibacter michiganensis TaxID=28447 RepID=UPI0009A577C8|nr:cysteine--tRNA ligase [Clavibacter michiganensis]KAF0259282.1 Cysteine--tRNA ligase [Clavibacter michiganensis subsp. michiganensis]MBF4639102.1 cysteine--tRNA ligase [Clavibacter michiganensis subsp. michiganensis]MBW8027647.1 cysteine--tRNA ligase [Clavibacter michiganensis subsp. michiganensis]MDO4031294.1 cysteine--tRNA ligase [Clavibacter michiganensis]MDO4075141.1 cysteine--tRNA ligase [Clavibacter michiganensis]